MCVYVYMRTSKKDVNDGECDVEGKRVDDKEKALQSRVNCPRFFYEARKRTDKCVFPSMSHTRFAIILFVLLLPLRLLRSLTLARDRAGHDALLWYNSPSPYRSTYWGLRIVNWRLQFNRSKQNGLKLKLSE